MCDVMLDRGGISLRLGALSLMGVVRLATPTA